MEDRVEHKDKEEIKYEVWHSMLNIGYINYCCRSWALSTVSHPHNANHFALKKRQAPDGVKVNQIF